MIFIYIGLVLLAALLILGAVCIVFKAGEKENICNYDYVGKGQKK